MAYRLLWSGRLWSVEVPEEVGSDEKLRWTYVQTFVATGGSHRSAMTRVLSIKYPGLAYGPVKLIPVSFVAASHGGVADVCASDMSVPVGSSNSRFQTPQPPPSARAAKGGASGISDQHTPTPRPAISNSSRPHGPRLAAPSQRPQKHRSRQPATPHTGGWMGSTSTTGAGR